MARWKAWHHCVPVDLMSDDQIDQVCSRHVIGLIPAAVLQALEISLLVLLRHLADPADHLLLFVDCLVPVRLLYNALLSTVPAGPSSWRSEGLLLVLWPLKVTSSIHHGTLWGPSRALPGRRMRGKPLLCFCQSR